MQPSKKSESRQEKYADRPMQKNYRRTAQRDNGQTRPLTLERR